MDEDKVSMTRVMFTSLMTRALEDQKNLADVTSTEAVKVVFNKGIKHRSERQTQPIHSSPIMTSCEYGLNAVYLLRPETVNVMGTLMMTIAIPIQQAAKLPVISTHYRDTDGNKTFQSVANFNTGKRYKRETNLKFPEGSVEQYKRFRSQFNIHHKMLGWDNNRAGIELYMSLEGKATLKVEEVIMNAQGMSNIVQMRTPSIMLSWL